VPHKPRNTIIKCLYVEKLQRLLLLIFYFSRATFLT